MISPRAPNTALQTMTFSTVMTLSIFKQLAGFRKAALAVSGGSDSMALMHWVAQWLTLLQRGAGQTDASQVPKEVPEIVVLTVDHGLRAKARQETEWVCEQAALLGFDCQILKWQGKKPDTGIQAAARMARYDLLIRYCREHHISALVTAHHRDDQAETVFMNLARGSGVDGLAGIAPRIVLADLTVLRPFLHLSKSSLAGKLDQFGGRYCEDPSNQDEDFERVRVRKMLRSNGQHPALDGAHLARVAQRARRARQALAFYTDRFLEDAAELTEIGVCLLDWVKFQAVPEEIQLRALQRILSVSGGGARDPALSAVEGLLAEFKSADMPGRTLGGCVLRRQDGRLLVMREGGRRGPRAVRIEPGSQLFWDQRFDVRLDGAATASLKIRALGHNGVQALKALAGDAFALSGKMAAVLPSAWMEDQLQAVPHAGFYRSEALGSQIEIRQMAALTGVVPQNLRHLG